MAKKPIQPIWNVKTRVSSIEIESLAELILKSRGLSDDNIAHFLNPSYSDDLADPFLLPDMSKAVRRLHRAIAAKQKIVIYGDYDIDGITASTLLVDFITTAGADATVYIPDRFEEGYGLNSDALKLLKKQNVDLVVSVDCGVTAAKEATLAKKIGLDLIITDHHEPPKVLPSDALAVVNPKLQSSKYPFSELAGVGVAFALVRAMLTKYPKLLKEGQEKWLLDLVALGTICDVVPLVGENRVLASYGLKVMAKTRREGIKALAKVSGTNLDLVQESDLGFRFGPRLNAAGRLEHAKAALDLLLCKDKAVALELAENLNELNRQRQEQTQEIFDAANAQAKKQTQNMVLVLADPAWSSGIVGIVASKIAEKWSKPTILLQINDDLAKGSARSYGDFSIIDALRDSSELLEKFGGHAFAAGMTLKTENIDALRFSLNKYALNNIEIESLLPKINIDVEINNLSPNLDYAEGIVKLRPHGNENPQPIISSKLKLIDYRLIGQNNNHTKFRFMTSNKTIIDAIAFNTTHKWPQLEPNQNYLVAYHLQINVWQNVSKAQLEIVDIKLS